MNDSSLSVATAELWDLPRGRVRKFNLFMACLFQKKPLSKSLPLPYAFLTQTCIC